MDTYLSGSGRVCCYKYIKTCEFCYGIYRYLYGYRSCLRYAGNFFFMRRNQQEAIRAERENNAKLETVNTELRQAKLLLDLFASCAT